MIPRAAGIGERAPSGGEAAARPAASRSGRLTLLRHGESEWNRTGRFTGWADVELTPAGEAEAAGAGRALRNGGYTFDCCFTSTLRRAIRSGEIALRAMGLAYVAVERSWRLNERHYGALQGLGPWSAVRRFGVLPVLHARWSYDYRPPEIEADDPRRADARGPADASATVLPRAESLADLRARLLPFWRERIAPELAGGRSVLVVSHKHTLRALLALTAPPGGPASSLGVATGVPIVLTLDGALAVTECRTLQIPRSR